MQEDDFKYFKEHHSELYREYPGKFIVIANKTVLFAEDSFPEALKTSMEKGLEPGTFLIQECTETEQGYVQEFHTRAIFL